MSKRRHVRKPTYVISDSDDDGDFVLPVAKRTKQSSQNLKPSPNLNTADRTLQKAKEMSSKQNKENNVFSSTPDSPSSGDSIVTSKKKGSKQIIISSPESAASQATPDPLENKTPETKQPGLKPSAKVDRLHLPNSGGVREAREARGQVKSVNTVQTVVDSDEEFKISPPESSEHSSSDSEFKISQISSESDQEQDHSDSDEAFKLESEEETKKPVKPKSNKILVKSTDDRSRTKATIPIKPCPKPDVTIRSKPAKSKPESQPKTKTSRPVRPSSIGSNNAKTINIPSILSRGSVSSQPVSSSPKIGLSKSAKFRPLHANVKRNA